MTKEPPIRECLLEEVHQAKIAPSDAQGSIRLLGSMLERCVQGTNENVTERVEAPDDGHVDATDSSAGSGVAADDGEEEQKDEAKADGLTSAGHTQRVLALLSDLPLASAELVPATLSAGVLTHSHTLIASSAPQSAPALLVVLRAVGTGEASELDDSVTLPVGSPLMQRSVELGLFATAASLLQSPGLPDLVVRRCCRLLCAGLRAEGVEGLATRLGLNVSSLSAIRAALKSYQHDAWVVEALSLILGTIASTFTEEPGASFARCSRFMQCLCMCALLTCLILQAYR